MHSDGDWAVVASVKDAMGPYADSSMIGFSVRSFDMLTRDEQSIAQNHCEDLLDEIRMLRTRNNPDVQIEQRRHAAMLLCLFQEAGIQPIYSELIPNGYCDRWCCVIKPWLIVTTPKGHIKIGWRKRVIAIDWARSDIAGLADELFPDENVTKMGRSVHAWGHDKAIEYLKVLFSERNVDVHENEDRAR